MYLKEVVQKTKNKGDRRYLQFVESVRTEKGPRQNILVNLGRIDNKDGRERLEILTQSLVELAHTVHLVDFDSQFFPQQLPQGCYPLRLQDGRDLP